MLRTMDSLCVPNSDSAPLSSMPKLQPINHFRQVNPLIPRLKLLELIKLELNSRVFLGRCIEFVGNSCFNCWLQLELHLPIWLATPGIYFASDRYKTRRWHFRSRIYESVRSLSVLAESIGITFIGVGGTLIYI